MRILRLAGFIALGLLLSAVLAGWTLHVRLLDVQTASMAPVFRPHDAVITLPADPARLQPGDIVAYRSPLISNQLVMHRVVEIDRRSRMLTVKGDRLQAVDPPVPFNAVQGRFVVALARGGRLLEFLKKPLGLALLVYVPAASIMMSEWFRLARLYRARYYILPGRA